MITRRNNRRFSLMVCGSKGSGKSALFNSLINKEIVGASGSKEVEVYIINLDCEGLFQKITFVDTPGFGDSMNDEELYNTVVEYIKNQFDIYIDEETKIRRNAKFEDTRVHCLIYLIPATGNGLKQRDIEFLKKINNLVNIIPVISKAEGYNSSELSSVKQLIKNQLEYYQINIFNFDNEDLIPTETVNERLNSYLPFSCVFPEKLNEESRTRNHYSGVIDVDDPSQNDYSRLRDAILQTHTEALIETTDTVLYENYRATTLENMIQE